MSNLTSDEEADYMSADFLSKIEDIRPGASRAHKRMLIISANREAAEERNIKKPKKAELEKIRLDEGLSQPISSESKGFSLLSKMGYKPGMSIGKKREEGAEGIKEPINMFFKGNRTGLGHDQEEKDKQQERCNLHLEAMAQKNVLADDFRIRKRSAAIKNILIGDIKKLRKACQELDIRLDMDHPEEWWFWPIYHDGIYDVQTTSVDDDLSIVELKKAMSERTAKVYAKVADAEAKYSYANKKEAPEDLKYHEMDETMLETRLATIVDYMRTKHFYCPWKLSILMSKAVKVLCAGDVNGNFKQLLNRVAAVNKKCGPFDVLFCVGEFFGPDEEKNAAVLNGEVQFPMPTYILGPCCPSTSQYYPEQSAELSSSLTYLGRKGILNTATGLTIGYLSGIESDSSTLNPFQFNGQTVDDLFMPVRANTGFLGLVNCFIRMIIFSLIPFQDILLTSMWPTDVWKHSTNQPKEEVQGSPQLARLAAGLKPRYHMAGLGQLHYERTPYRNHQVLIEAAQHVTRFIGLASVDNPANEKWLYGIVLNLINFVNACFLAFSIVPMRKMERAELTQQPDNSTEFPYMELLQEFRRRKAEEEALAAKSKGENQFFFDVEADLTEEDPVDRGGRRKRPGYGEDGGRMAKQRPKFQQVDPDSCWFCLSNTAVVKHLIGEYFACIINIYRPYVVVSVGTTCYAAMPKGPLTDDHVLVMSIVPIPKSSAKALRSSFLNSARLKEIEFTFLKENEHIWELVNEGAPYFYVELPDGTKMFSRSMAGFPIQFGSEQLKADFKPFDFTNDGDSSDED
ncbi:g-patch domain-containing protein [Ditylenchus destructor]|nr:g-patch domain-containing protein [Ditylenchus destructor]